MRAKALLEMHINKSDRNDAVGIARIMQTGWFTEARAKDFDCHAIKALLTNVRGKVRISRTCNKSPLAICRGNGSLAN